MSAGGGIIGKVVDPLGIFSAGGEKKKESSEAPIADKAIEARGTDFATREQVIGQRAAAAGATRSSNDADLLGYVLPKKRSAGREILG